jgi:beta-galactosidase
MADRTADKIQELNRRRFIGACALGATLAASSTVVGFAGNGRQRGASSLTLSLNQDWLFGGKFVEGAGQPQFSDAKFSSVTLPHCVANLSSQGWRPEDWQAVWIYRRHFSLPRDFRGRRVFLDFERVMTGATPVLNGKALAEHLGGYLPFQYEVTEWVRQGENVLAVSVDSRWKNVPPDGSPKGAAGVDYLEPGGITGSVALRAMPQIFISDVFAKPVNVLGSDRNVEITCSVDAARPPEKPLQLRVEMLDEGRRVVAVSRAINLENVGMTQFKLTLTNLGNVQLWDVNSPKVYEIATTLLENKRPLHEHRTRIGLREAQFDLDGFSLNGRRLRLFGLNRHEIYPYVGMAMPGRVMRRDAVILRHEFNCNVVRCSHYPQTEAFLDACDELGLMVWEETPGWGFLGDEAWKEFVVRDVKEMVLRDRNHPSIVIWGVRVNESRNDQPLYQRTTEIAKSLDGTRATSGSMTPGSRKNWQSEWHEDVFAYDDYHSAPDGSVGIDAPVPAVPYLLAEAVGQFAYGLEKKGFANKYQRAGDLKLQTAQALYHAQAHSRAAAYPHCSGVIAWCAFDYSSLVNSFNAVKCPGVADVFRIPKLGAAFYQAQISPKIRPVIQPAFYWDFGANSPRGPGTQAAIFSNCDRLELFIAGKQVATLQPDGKNYPHLEYPPFFCDLDVEGKGNPELRIDGYMGDKLAVSKSFSADTSQDKFLFAADDRELASDGSDATRLVFRVADKYGEPRPFAGGEVLFGIAGPGILVGDNPFSLTDSGGVGAIWVKSVPNRTGRIIVKATHSVLGAKAVAINVV